MTKLILLFSLFTLSVQAEDTMKLYYSNEDITRVIEAYAKASGQKFIIEPSVRGKISILNQDRVSITEAFNQLSAALGTAGFAIVKRDDNYIVRPARSVQRDMVEVGSELPAVKPERMFTWVVTPKHISAKNFLRDVRLTLSRDGESSVHEATNQLVFTDWVSSLHHIAGILKEVDKPVENPTGKKPAKKRAEPGY